MSASPPFRHLRSGAASILLCACATGQNAVVRDQASWELRCAPEDIAVTRVRPLVYGKHGPANSGYVGKAIYRAVCRGQVRYFVCEGWDSYEQRSICGPGQDGDPGAR